MKRDSGAYAIDANVIVRYVVGDGEALFAKATAIIEGVEDGKQRVLCDPVTLAEVVFVLQRMYKLDRGDISSALDPILKMDGFWIENKSRYLKALDLFATDVPHFGDACACAAALDACEGRLVSFDKGLSRMEGIQRTEEV